MKYRIYVQLFYPAFRNKSQSSKKHQSPKNYSKNNFEIDFNGKIKEINSVIERLEQAGKESPIPPEFIEFWSVFKNLANG